MSETWNYISKESKMERPIPIIIIRLEKFDIRRLTAFEIHFAITCVHSNAVLLYPNI